MYRLSIGYENLADPADPCLNVVDIARLLPVLLVDQCTEDVGVG
jgi:hypothetical protein